MAGRQPITARGALSVSHDGQRIAYSSDALYVQNVDGGAAAKLAGVKYSRKSPSFIVTVMKFVVPDAFSFAAILGPLRIFVPVKSESVA